jgi:hypothetical protein
MVLHFGKDEIPPVTAFWSLTLYDKEGFQVAHRLNRFALGDRDPLKFNPDGSLDLFIQHENPGPGEGSELAAGASHRSARPDAPALRPAAGGADREVDSRRDSGKKAFATVPR